MPKLPEKVQQLDMVEKLTKSGLVLRHRGKVRDIYDIPGHSELMLMIMTDRISIFDKVLPVLIPRKGEVLTALTHFWLTRVLDGYENHLVNMTGDRTRNAVHEFKPIYPDIPLERSLVVRKVKIPPYEMIYRFHLGGSVFAKYLETGQAAGIDLPRNLPKWTKLDYALFTPSTKDVEDVNITAEEYFQAMGAAGRRAATMFGQAYTKAYNFARERGILILDSKFEGLYVIADEVLTPDSSRFTTIEDFIRAMAEKRDPVFYDKQPVRDFGMTIDTPFGVKGLNKLNPANEDHLAFISTLKIPEKVISDTSHRYAEILQRLMLQSLSRYQKDAMHI